MTGIADLSLLQGAAATASLLFSTSLARFIYRKKHRRGEVRPEAHGLLYAVLLTLSVHLLTNGIARWPAFEHQPFWVATLALLLLIAPQGPRATILQPLLGTAILGVVVIFPVTALEWKEPGTIWTARIGLLLGCWACLQVTARRAPRAARLELPVLHGALLAGLGALAYASGYARFLTLAGAVGAGLLPVCLVILFRKNRRLPATISTFLILLGLTLLLGIWFHLLDSQRAPRASYLLLTVPLLAPVLGELPFLKSRPRLTAGLVLTLGVLAVAASIALPLVTAGEEAAGTEAEYDWEF